MKKITNLKEFKNILPYDSEIFGVYQPLLGWKSKRIESRFLDSFRKDRQQTIEALAQNFKGNFDVGFDGEYIGIEYISPGLYKTSDSVYESTVVKMISEKLPKEDEYQDGIWDEFISYDALNSLLMNEVREVCKKEYSRLYKDLQGEDLENNIAPQIITEKINRESVISGAILYLKERKYFNYLKQIFYDSNKNLTLDFLLNIRNYNNPFDSIDPKNDLDRVGLSPVGIVHLFRQYFFEFDTFLGTPVGHIWLSPGSSVELVEISTRKTITERLTEAFIESIIKSEKSLTEEDEISEAVKQDNQTNTKFGAAVNANQSWIFGSANQTASFDLDTTQKTAREETHKHMRQQTEKLSSEIKKNFKTTFKTITETTEISSKRYLLANNTDSLINYELRRKMRQVGVQVQDIGTYLCWQTYVDDPGKQLGVANLVNIASPSDLQNIQAPELIAEPESLIKGTPTTQNYVWAFGDERKYLFVPTSEIQIVPPKYGYIYDRSEFTLISGDRWDFQIREVNSEEIDTGAGNGTKEKSVKSIIVGIQPGPNGLATNERPQFSYQVTVLYKPSQKLVKDIKTANDTKIQATTAEKLRLFRESFIKAAKDRIKLASNIQSRKYEELREEERIVVYRRLIQELLTKGITFPNDNTRHIVSELINSIFDVEKMLYFVAPEWWRPRLHQSRQTFGSLVPAINPDGTIKIGADGKPILVPDPNTSISPESVVSWGGINENREDNYYITEDSAPAKLGSSLGWLLQLDADNLRNAFLNAPWVKAVIPIRPGKEKAAINWLKQVEGLNGIGPSDMYTGNEPELQGKTMLEALEILAKKVAEKHDKSNEVRDIPDPDNPTDTDNTVSTTPVDKVYEHGFYPLQGGFRVNVGEQFEIFDQWIEILPTDQVVAVEVNYDPKTGRQI